MLDLVRHSHTDPPEIARVSAADRLMPDACERWVRGRDVHAPPEIVYRWLCQLTVAPYSFDIVDFLGRRSPSTLTPGAQNLRVGQDFLIFAIAEFQPGSFIAGTSRPEFQASFGRIAVSYEAVPRSDGTTRLVANACVSDDMSPVARALLAAGDKVMAGRQLHRLKGLAELTHRRRPRS